MKLILALTVLMLSNCTQKEPSIATRINNTLDSADHGILCQRSDEVVDYNNKSCYRVERETGPVIVGAEKITISEPKKEIEKPAVTIKKQVKKIKKHKKSLAEMCISNGFKKEAKK